MWALLRGDPKQRCKPARKPGKCAHISICRLFMVVFLLRSSAMRVHEQSLKKEYKPWKWGATARDYASHTIDHVTKEEVRTKIQQAIGLQENLLTTVKTHKLQWYGHVSHSSGLAKTILQGIHSKREKKTKQSEEEVGRWHQGMDRSWVGKVPEGSGEYRKMEETGCENICGAPTTFAV